MACNGNWPVPGASEACDYSVFGNIPAVNGVSGFIREMIYRGDHCELFIDPFDLRVQTSSVRGLSLGQKVHLELPLDHLEVLVD